MERINVVVPLFDGVTTAIVAFCFVCVIFPNLVKNKAQFYAGFSAILLVIFLHGMTLMLYSTIGFRVFAGVLTCLLQIVAIVTLFLSAGGITLKQLGGDMARAYEVIRRGEEEKTVIVPISGEMPNKPANRPVAPSVRDDHEEPTAHRIDLPDDAGWQRKPVPPAAPPAPASPPSPPSPPAEDSRIPLE